MDRGSKPFDRKTKVLVFLIIVALAALFSLGLSFLFPDRNAIALTCGSTDTFGGSLVSGQGQDAAAASAAQPTETDPAKEQDLIPIYLVGAVRRPGIYLVNRGSYLYELVEQAGGLAEDAAADAINLAFRIEDNQRIRLPFRQEQVQGTGAAAQGSGDLAITDDTGAGLVNINSASADELDNLPGIGPATARAILAYREEHGRFQKIEDLMQVPGIKESRFSSLKDLICVSGGFTA